MSSSKLVYLEALPMEPVQTPVLRGVGFSTLLAYT